MRLALLPGLALALLTPSDHAIADNAPKSLRANGGLVSLRRAPRRVTPEFPLSDQRNRGGWVLREDVSDEFEGDSLDESRWKLGARKWRGREPTLFHESNVSVDDGELVFRINQHGPSVQLPEGYTHTSGFIHSRERMLYGYYEAELRLMDAPWVSGFWMSYGDAEWWTEIDICENCPYGDERANRLNSNIHIFRSPPEYGGVTEHFSRSVKFEMPVDMRDDYHVWGLEWDEEAIRFYIDGVLIRKAKNTHWFQPLAINLNNESNKWLSGPPEDDRTDREYRVRYVRVWTRDEQ